MQGEQTEDPPELGKPPLIACVLHSLLCGDGNKFLSCLHSRHSQGRFLPPERGLDTTLSHPYRHRQQVQAQKKSICPIKCTCFHALSGELMSLRKCSKLLISPDAKPMWSRILCLRGEQKISGLKKSIKESSIPCLLMVKCLWRV